MKKLYKGIEPIIAVIILVAVTLVIAIGVIGWIMGWWGALGATESLQLFGDSVLLANGQLQLHVKNTGSAAAVIYKVEVVGIGSATADITLTPGQETTSPIQITATGTIVPGTVYQVKVFTKAGNTYQVNVQARASA